MLTTIVLFIAILSLLVFAHELGHFISARKMGIEVEEFGFGFPPRIFGWKRGETVFSVNWIPLGGFVRLRGETGGDIESKNSFASKSAWRRFIVLIAGVAMNLILAAILLTAGFIIGLPTVIEGELPNGAVVSDEAVRVVYVAPESPAENANIKVGDKLLALDGKVFSIASDAVDYIHSNNEKSILITLERGGSYIEENIKPAEFGGENNKAALGVALVKTGLVSYPVHLAVVQGVASTFGFSAEVIRSLLELIKNIFTSGKAGMDLSGPVGIAVLTGEVADLGVPYLIQFMALLSINLAIINVLPFPALDGGRILFIVLEKIRRRPISHRFEAMAHNLGFMFLMSLVVLVTYRDIARFGDEIFGVIKSAIGV